MAKKGKAGKSSGKKSSHAKMSVKHAKKSSSKKSSKSKSSTSVKSASSARAQINAITCDPQCVKHTPRCSTCGYTKIHLHAGDCPLCKLCRRCGSRVRHCTCIEGE